jgi:hypothetical protein
MILIKLPAKAENGAALLAPTRHVPAISRNQTIYIANASAAAMTREPEIISRVNRSMAPNLQTFKPQAFKPASHA